LNLSSAHLMVNETWRRGYGHWRRENAEQQGGHGKSNKPAVYATIKSTCQEPIQLSAIEQKVELRTKKPHEAWRKLAMLMRPMVSKECIGKRKDGRMFILS
jgi:hypothetical protein